MNAPGLAGSGKAPIRRVTERIMKDFIVICFLGMFAAMPLASGAATAASSQTGSGNRYMSGGEVRLTEPVAADLYAAGGKVTIAQPVAEDAALAGGQVDVLAAIGQDLRATGGKIRVNANVGGDLLVAGGDVAIGKDSRVGGDLLAAGGDVQFAGAVTGGAKLTGGKVTVAGQISGDTVLYAQEIVMAPGARIGGNLTYASSKPLSTEEAGMVSGAVKREGAPRDWAPRSPISWFHPVFFVSMLACGSLLFILFPNAVSGTQQTMRQTPLRSLLVGIALLCTLPPVAVLFMVSIIGIPVGFALLALYPLLLLLGYLGAAFFVSRTTADAMHRANRPGRAWQIGFLAIGLALLALAASVPFLGGLLVFVAIVTGVGGWAQWLYRRYRTSHPGIAAQP